MLLASAPGTIARGEAAAREFRPVADRIAAASLRAYRTLVDTEGLAGWLARISPLEEISEMRIGSRPARRSRRRGGLDGHAKRIRGLSSM